MIRPESASISLTLVKASSVMCFLSGVNSHIHAVFFKRNALSSLLVDIKPAELQYPVTCDLCGTMTGDQSYLHADVIICCALRGQVEMRLEKDHFRCFPIDPMFPI